jgi:hypothetical protein
VVDDVVLVGSFLTEMLETAVTAIAEANNSGIMTAPTRAKANLPT